MNNPGGIPQAIPVSVITGFLGAGKTSLIRHILRSGGDGFALIVNEFGEVGVDGDLVRGDCAACDDEQSDRPTNDMANDMVAASSRAPQSNKDGSNKPQSNKNGSSKPQPNKNESSKDGANKNVSNEEAPDRKTPAVTPVRDAIIELTNGCICCTVADDFVPAMRRIREMQTKDGKPIRHVLVETSGLALPGPLVDAFGWPEIRSHFRIDSLIGVVDSELALKLCSDPALASILGGSDNDHPGRGTLDNNHPDKGDLGGAPPDIQAAIPPDIQGNIQGNIQADIQANTPPVLGHDLDTAELLYRQLHACDLLALNKADLVDAAGLERLTRALYLTSPRAKILPCTQGCLPLSVLLGGNFTPSPMGTTGAKAHGDHEDGHDHGHRHENGHGHEEGHGHENGHGHGNGHDHHDHAHDAFFSFTVEMAQCADPEDAQMRVEKATALVGVVRIKGHVRVIGKSMPLVIQAAGRRVSHYYARRNDHGAATLVVIAARQSDEAAIRKILTAPFGRVSASHSGTGRSGTDDSRGSHSGTGRSDITHSGIGHSGADDSRGNHSGITHSGTGHSGIKHSGTGRSDINHSGADNPGDGDPLLAPAHAAVDPSSDKA